MFHDIRHHYSPVVRIFGTALVVLTFFVVFSGICYALYQSGTEVWFAVPLIIVGCVSFVGLVISLVQTFTMFFFNPFDSF